MSATAGLIKWDQSGDRQYELGVKHGVFYTDGTGLSEAPSSTAPTTNYGVAWNGLAAVTEKPSGADLKEIYADNIKYCSIRAAEKFGATMEVYTYPDEFMACDGSETLVPGLTISGQARHNFGLAYITGVGDDTTTAAGTIGEKIHIIYNASVSPSERAYKTINDSPEAMTFSYELASDGVMMANGKQVCHMVIDCSKFATNQTALNNLKDMLFGKDATTGQSATQAKYPFLPTPDLVHTTLATVDLGGGGD